jgi:hypothetical protein
MALIFHPATRSMWPGPTAGTAPQPGHGFTKPFPYPSRVGVTTSPATLAHCPQGQLNGRATHPSCRPRETGVRGAGRF